MNKLYLLGTIEINALLKRCVHHVIVFCFILTITTIQAAEPRSVFDTYVVIDKRDKFEGTTDYFIAFSARPSPSSSGGGTGHAYISWQKKEMNSSLLTETVSFGLYPETGKGMWSVIFSVKGELVNELEKEGIQSAISRLVVQVNEDQYNNSLAVYNDMKTKEGLRFSLFIKNCVNFVDDVAKSIGLERPDTFASYPKDYIQSLIMHNIYAGISPPNPPTIGN